jgi:molybdopterin-guanine dinucleotide biosynthesis protein A
MLGIILCGGESSRMKSDKGLLTYNAKTWAETAFKTLSTLHIPINISVNEQQFIAYSKIFSQDLLIVDSALVKIKGPLLGLLSSHIKNLAEDLFILATDTLFMNSNILKELVEIYKEDKVHEVYIFTNVTEPEPLCGIYTHKGLKKIIDLYKTDNLLKHSMKYVLSQLNVCFVPIKDEYKKGFTNFNTENDLLLF